MPTKTELLNKGLYNAQDRIFTPEGGLTKAKNARYKPSDSAIWHAEGRQVMADGGHGVDGEMSQVVGLQWDPGTDFGSPSNIFKGTQHQQICYVKNGHTLTTVEAKSNPADAAMNKGNAWSFTMPSGVSIGPDPLVAIGIENKHVLLSGGENAVMVRGANPGSDATGRPQRVLRHGLPAQILPLAPAISAVAGNWNADIGRHYFWFTWYDSTHSIESEATIAAAGGQPDRGTSLLLTGAVTYLAAQTNITADVLINKATFDAAVPSSATGIRLYKSIASDLFSPNPWPQAYLVKDITFVSDLDGNRFASFNETLYTVYVFGDTSHTDPTDEAADNNLTNLFKYEGGMVALQGLNTSYSFRGEPPRASTGDVFQESLVLNDKDDPRKIKYSYPQKGLHAFPTVWHFNFETAQTDKVVAIRTLGNRLGVFLTNSVWRVNWLPTQADFDFQRGRTDDIVTEGLGTNGHYGVAKFTMPGKGPMLAFVDPTGVYVTDLYSTTKISTHMDWSLVKNVANAMIVDDPINERLVLRGGPEMWFFHYDVTHLSGGLPAVTGPITRSEGISGINTVVLESGQVQLVTSDEENSLYYEGFGFENSMLVNTREIYPLGIGNEVNIQRFYVHLKPSTQGGGLVAVRIKTGTADREQFKDFPFQPLQERKLRPYTTSGLAEYYVMEMALTSGGASNALNFVALDSDSLGEAQSVVGSIPKGIG